MGDFRDWRPFVYGGLASIIAEFGTFPIDTTKTRLQIQGQQIDPKHVKLRYTGMLDCFVKTSRQEGFKALYCGAFKDHILLPAVLAVIPMLPCLFLPLIWEPPTSIASNFKTVLETVTGLASARSAAWRDVLRQATYGTIKFGTYYSLKEAVIARGWGAGAEGAGVAGVAGERAEHVGWNAACAGVAGALSAALATPTDVLKVRMQMGEALAMGGGGALWRSLAAVARAEGLRGLWRGVTPTAQRAATIAAVELPVYDGVKRRLRPTLGDRPANHFASSLLASAASALASTPLDVIRTRLMHQRRVPGCHIYAGTLDCMIQTVRLEGWAALYKGLVPTWLRMGPWNVIFFLTYEQLKLFY